MTSKAKRQVERGSDGRFTAGNNGGPGRPRRDTEREYLAAFQRALSAEDLEAVTRSVLECALAGNVAACRLLFEYAIGKPTEKLEFQQVEEYRVAGVSPAEGMTQMLKRIQKATKERRAYEKNIAASQQKPRGQK